MQLRDFNYYLPCNLIAQRPVKPQDQARLLIYSLAAKKIQHDIFFHLDEHLRPGDVLVFNNSRVIPARLYGHKPTGGRVEIFLLRKILRNSWQCLIRGKVKINSVIALPKKYQGIITAKLGDGRWRIKFNKADVLSIGQTPTPPYIKTHAVMADYQTVYAKVNGSVAAPTAGLHFTKRLFNKLKRRGVQLEFITLHVGLGTFAPVKEENIARHKMHAEFCTINKAVSRRLLQAKKQGRRVIAVGTTAARTLEALKMQPRSGWTDIFIYPGYKFKYCHGLITNFHLPKSTLLMLVAALAGTDNIKHLYKIAIKKHYRFYSFGDGMFIC